jgi:Xaa-Pro dipeptidase
MTVSTFQLKISAEEYKARCDLLLEHIQEQKYGGVVLFDADYIKYYAGFAFIPTERPMAFAMSAKGERALLVPRLEAEHASSNVLIERVAHYIEFPAEPHPMHVLSAMLEDMGFVGEIAADDYR